MDVFHGQTLCATIPFANHLKPELIQTSRIHWTILFWSLLIQKFRPSNDGSKMRLIKAIWGWTSVELCYGVTLTSAQ